MRKLFHGLASAAALLILGGSAFAQNPRHIAPDYFVVSNVSEGDTLSVRAKPAATSQKLGELAPGEGPIEVLRVVRNGRTDWAEIIFNEGNAFVARRFLKRVSIKTVGQSAIPRRLQCFGTEPFWGTWFLPNGKLRLEELASGVETVFDIDNIVTAQNRGGRPAIIRLSAGNRTGFLSIDATWCTDGMSDRDYAWRAKLFLSGNGGRLLDGCCQVQLDGGN